MALDKDRLGQALWTRVKSLNTYTPAIGAPEDLRGLQLWTAVADEVINEFKNNAVVPVAVDNVTLVTPGSGSSGPGTGTGTIT